MKSKNQTVNNLTRDASILMKAAGFSVNNIQVIIEAEGHEDYFDLSSETQRHFYVVLKKVLDENLGTIVNKTLAEIALKLGEEQASEEAIVNQAFREISHKITLRAESLGASESNPRQTDLTSEAIDDAMRNFLDEQTKGEQK